MFVNLKFVLVLLAVTSSVVASPCAKHSSSKKAPPHKTTPAHHKSTSVHHKTTAVHHKTTVVHHPTTSSHKKPPVHHKTTVHHPTTSSHKKPPVHHKTTVHHPTTSSHKKPPAQTTTHSKSAPAHHPTHPPSHSSIHHSSKTTVHHTTTKHHAPSSTPDGCTQKINYYWPGYNWALEFWSKPGCSGPKPDYYSHSLASKPVGHHSDCIPLLHTAGDVGSFIFKAESTKYVRFYSDASCKDPLYGSEMSSTTAGFRAVDILHSNPIVKKAHSFQVYVGAPSIAT
ncbi:hypothetical protein BJ138DRAFT_1101062 [Hygrophoropsis aurantiaca]|uniref:Uncharacterized protein n=1 Tax=Hygrophoropsis aurantiaca TaxID=72124 RepID=A0ACB8AFW0_9AGAM|nr:hypothetical protein BJ138DRAFT_1101062 [Hygrophoropsis aurantiaca]